MLLHHPSFPDITEEVPDDAADVWLQLGWREDGPPAPAEPQAATPESVTEPAAAPDTIGGDTPDGDDQGTKKK